ncbi:Dolichyl-diphosphooligosaccharide--protein glycosyltransferase subunit TMEM258 [Caenorhabditis elegans]|uniref:Dolichyl-diphosphooligosaccharide--protein glycosyltransferase subunit TMEM258 n=1 Tax=Caenorhabditis elegans TaxID=6239 RepID=TM258_CAEEL|nr:Transmembrane protein 258 [Caenorhabditis elegans]Q965T1.1 RecName: Full=Transmembrane protein 258; AltName: Full=Dolichyl-diphosphooligosaccharide--protein glycosyltransferase subunit TMEM258; Short=Oligosaccharyl transferase subunit TMEM258 [Caenorhabditis elegans]CCD74331.1 Transmembrane protein 258 [Caenorhabditis elegans]|eukprot:NP_504794.1 Transmembrane protein 258 [Caenorhabditis elegans]
MDISKMNRYTAPVNFASLPLLTTFLCGVGLLLLATFTMIQVTSTKYNRNLLKELFIAATSSVFLGFGSVFLLLWVGIYV